MQIELTTEPMKLTLEDYVCPKCRSAKIGQADTADACYHCRQVPNHRVNEADKVREMMRLEQKVKDGFVLILGALTILLILWGSGSLPGQTKEGGSEVYSNFKDR